MRAGEAASPYLHCSHLGCEVGVGQSGGGAHNSASAGGETVLVQSKETGKSEVTDLTHDPNTKIWSQGDGEAECSYVADRIWWIGVGHKPYTNPTYTHKHMRGCGP